jgi:hypothetical protein
LNPNVTKNTVIRYVISGDKQIPPGENPDNLIQISETATFEENLGFVSTHICDAKMLNNLRGR